MTEEQGPRGGPLWQMPLDHLWAALSMFEGMSVKIRYSLDGTLREQAIAEGVLRHPNVSAPRFVVLAGQRRGDRETVILVSRVIDAYPTSVTLVPGAVVRESPGRQTKNPLRTCPTSTCHPEIPGWTIHCGRCPCCPTIPKPEGP